MGITLQDKPQIQGLSSRSEPFSLGDWRVQPQLNRMGHRGGAVRQLEPRLMHLLCVLADNPDRVLTREELVATIWPRVIVNENSLTRAISELRKQLVVSGAENPVYVETIPKRGYRLLSENLLSANTSAVPTGAPRLGRTALLGWQRRMFPGSASFSFLLLVLIGSWLGAASPTTSDPGLEPQTLVLRDEIMLPHSSLPESGLAVRTADVGQLDKDAAETPVLSRDGSRFAYIQYDPMGSTIYLSNLEDMTEPVAVYYCDSYLYNLSWSPLGNALLFAQKPAMTTALYGNRDERAVLMRLDLDSFKATRLVDAEQSTENSSPSTAIKLT